MAPAPVNNNAKSNADTGQDVTLSNASVKKLEDMSRWRVYIALALEAKPILENQQLTCPEDITDDADKKIWEFKSKTLFSIMYARLKPSVRRMIIDRINTKSPSAAKLWIVLETEYRDYAFHSQEDLTDKLMNIAEFNGDVIKYINAFMDVDLEEPLPKWFVTDCFIAGLNNHQWDFIQMQKDKTRDWRNKAKIEERDLRFIMEGLIAHAMNRADRG